MNKLEECDTIKRVEDTKNNDDWITINAQLITGSRRPRGFVSLLSADFITKKKRAHESG